MLTANALDLVRGFEAMSERTQMLTPGRRRWRERLIRPERDAPIAAAVALLPVDIEGLLGLSGRWQDQRRAGSSRKRFRSVDERCRHQSPSPNQKMSTINHGCSPSFAHASESRTTYCCPHGPHRHSPPLPVKAGWRGIKPSLDALLDVAAAGSAIKAGRSNGR